MKKQINTKTAFIFDLSEFFDTFVSLQGKHDKNSREARKTALLRTLF